MTTTHTTCSCGTTEPHKVATRETADGKKISLWSDGDVTTCMGWAIKGVGHARSRYATRKHLEAGWLAFADLCVYDYAEVGKLIQAARKAVLQHNFEPREYLRRTMAGERFRRVGAVIHKVST